MDDVTRRQQEIWDGMSPQGYEESTYASPIMRILRERHTLGKWTSECEGKKVLDIGCGHGEVSLAIAPTAKCVVGTDLSFSFLLSARKNLLQRHRLALPVLQADGMDLPFCSGSFDVVVSHGGIHHISDQSRAIGEIARILKPGGIFFAYEPNKNGIFTCIDFYSQLLFNDAEFLKPLQKKLIGHSYIERMRAEAELHPSLLSYEEYERAFRNNGFSFTCAKLVHPIVPLRLLKLEYSERAWEAIYAISNLLTRLRIPTLKNKEGFLIFRAVKHDAD